jgi:hypothetical protein
LLLAGKAAPAVVTEAAELSIAYLTNAQPANTVAVPLEHQGPCSFKVTKYGEVDMGVEDFDRALTEAGDTDHGKPYLEELSPAELIERGMSLDGLGQPSRTDRWVFPEVIQDACLEAHRRLEAVEMPNYNFGGDGDSQTFMPGYNAESISI